MSSHSAGSSSLVGTDAIPAVEIPGSKPKPVNYKALHSIAKAKWSFDYQHGHGKVHPIQRAHLAEKIGWHNDRVSRIEETERRLLACTKEYQAKVLEIMEGVDMPYTPPIRPGNPWGAVANPPSHSGPEKSPADGPPKPQKTQWKKEYEAMKGAMERVDACTVTRAEIKDEIEASNEAETRHKRKLDDLQKRVFEGRDSGVDFCVYKWRRDAVFENERVV